jgi:uncharacterized membrane protein
MWRVIALYRNAAPGMGAEVGTGRLEAFSDGVFAVAITLLVLDLHVSPEDPAGLAAQLAREWPAFAAYALSFLVIGVVWVNHHSLLALAARADRILMFFNLMLLMWVATIPFTTATLAGFIRAGGSDTRLAVLLYGVSNEGMALSFVAMLARMIHGALLRQPVSVREGRVGMARFSVAALLYPLAVVVGLFSPVAMLVCYACISGFYALEQTPILRTTRPPSGSVESDSEGLTHP